jgi:hypothetical protein
MYVYMLVSHDNGPGGFVAMGTEVPDLQLTRGAGRENLHLHSARERRHGSIVSIIWNRERGKGRERGGGERDMWVNYTSDIVHGA